MKLSTWLFVLSLAFALNNHRFISAPIQTPSWNSLLHVLYINKIFRTKLIPAPLTCTDNAYKLLANAEKPKHLLGWAATCPERQGIIKMLLLSDYTDLILGCFDLKLFVSIGFFARVILVSTVWPDLMRQQWTDGSVCLKGLRLN